MAQGGASRSDSLSGGAEPAAKMQPDDHSETEILVACAWSRSTGKNRVHGTGDFGGRDVLCEVEKLSECHLCIRCTRAAQRPPVT